LSSKIQPSNNQRGAANAVEARGDVTDNGAAADNIVIWAKRPNLAKIASGLAPSITPAVEPRPQDASSWSTPWSWIWDSIVMGYALYAASMYPGAFLLEQHDGIEHPVDAPNRGSPDVCRARPAACETKMPGRCGHAAIAVAPWRRRMWSGPSRNLVAALWAQWRRERDIKKGMAARE
jgi:hypothetical protein